MAPCNGTQQWHHVHSQSWSSPSPPPHNDSTLQWHPAMAPRPLPQSWSSPSPTMAPLRCTAMAPRPLTLQWHPGAPRQSAKVVRRPPPVLEVRTPIAIAIWGTIVQHGFQPPNGFKYVPKQDKTPTYVVKRPSFFSLLTLLTLFRIRICSFQWCWGSEMTSVHP